MAGVRQAVRITRESTFGTFNGSALAADKATIILSQDNPMTLQMKPRIWEVRNAAYDGRAVRQGTAQSETSGKLSTFLYPSQCKLLLELATKLSSGACRALDSFTLDYIHLLEDGSCTPTYERFLGCQIAKIDVNSNNNGQGVLVMADSDIVAQKRTTIPSIDFPEPLSTDYPDQNPYVFQDSAGTLLIASSITNYSSLNLSITNTIQQRWDENRYPARSKWRERQTTLSVTLLEKNNDLRDAFENQTALSVEYNYNNGIDNLKIDLNTRNYVQSLTNNRPLSGDFEQTAVIRNRIDPALNTDLTMTYPS